MNAPKIAPTAFAFIMGTKFVPVMHANALKELGIVKVAGQKICSED
jgi:hypothetical protein